MTDTPTPVVTPPPPPADTTPDAIAHASALLGVPLPVIGGVLGPLLVWLIRGDKSPGPSVLEALNFNLSFLIWKAVAGLLVLVLIGYVLLPMVWTTWIVLVIVGVVKAAQGRPWKYPLTIRFFD